MQTNSHCYSKLAMRQIISELMEHDHEQLSELLEELHSALTEHDAARAFELLDMFWARLAIHIRAENVCLFPAILRAVPAQYAAGLPTIDEVKSAIDKLRSDHNFFMDQLSQAVKTMREVISGDEKPALVVEAFGEILDRVNDLTSDRA